MKTALRSCAAAALGALALLPAGASANVQVGSSGWQWGNPLPQGNTLRSMAFAGTTGYAVGDFGTLLKTEDGGTNWAGLPAGTFTNLTEIQALDANTIFAGGGCVARRSTDGGRTFTRIAFTPVESSCPDGSKLASMWFTSAAHGYLALADGSIFETPNGGQEFTPKTGLPGTSITGGQARPVDLRFVSDTAGFASTSDGKIFQTTDGANSWKPVSDTARQVNQIAFVTDKIGYAVGTGGLFLKTSDGGASWVPKDASGAGPQDFTGIACVDEKLCVLTTRSGAVLPRTDDGGTTFTAPTPATDPIFAAGFATPTRVVAAGQSGATVVSDDAGLNFAPIGGRLLGAFSRVRAGKVAGSAFAPGSDGALAKTLDGGKTWARINVATSQDVVDVSFPTTTQGYALDQAGGLFRTTSGGAAWAPLDTGTTARPAAVYAPAAETVIIVGPTGLRRSTDAGATFETVKGKAVVKAKLRDADAAGSATFAYGDQELIRSTDGGRTWTSVRKPGRYVKRGKRSVNRLSIQTVDFLDAKRGFLLDANGRVWRTTDGGKRWAELPGVGTDAARGMAFASTKQGYLVIDRFGDVSNRTGFLLRTDDGGATWHPQFVESQIIPNGGVAATPSADYLLGGTSALLSTTAGGDAGGASALSIKAPRKRYKKPAHITVTGKLSPAAGNERVTVSYRRPGSLAWREQTVKVSANGTFTTSWDLARGDNVFVAQWAGDFRSRGDGSKLLTVPVSK